MPFADYQIPQIPEWDPSQGDLTRQQGLYPTDLIHKPQGYPATSLEAVNALKAQGWWQCPTQKDNNGKPCGFWLNPQAKAKLEATSGYFTCPRCYHTYNLMEELPWHGPTDVEEAFGDEFKSGGSTRIGIPLADQGQIGENLVTEMGEFPGFGPITWWHPGGAGAQSPLDGTVKDWGVEVKPVGFDAMHHRFAPGGEGDYFEDKNKEAAQMNLKGVLGILVLLNYRNDTADIYMKPMPLERWAYQPGKFTQGVAQFRKNNATKIASGVPFQSPYKDPNSPVPTEYRVQDYYQRPQPVMPQQPQRVQAPPSEPIPF